MTLSLFDEPTTRPPRPVTLVRLSGEIARSLVGIGRIAVEGEVYRPTRSRGGWVFFTLRDRAAQMEVKVPAGAASRSRIVAGERVSVVATLQWSNDRGQLALLAEEVMPVGSGAIAALISETRERLTADGLIDRPRRRLPVLPAAVGVLCGADAAVRKDIESVVAARCVGYPMVFEETTVSGPAAAQSIVEGLARLQERPGVEVIILARGGGDAPSLLPWSSEEVCRAVAGCPVPVVSAIGHEGDRPLCDEVADLRSGTPSLAATAVLPDLAALRLSVDSALERAAAALEAHVGMSQRRLAGVDVHRAVLAGLDRSGARLDRAGLRLEAQHPARRLASAEARLAGLDWRRPAWEALGRAAGRLEAEKRHLQALSPWRTLERGYAVLTGADGAVVRRSIDLRVGDSLTARLASGSVEATVTRVIPPEVGP